MNLEEAGSSGGYVCFFRSGAPSPQYSTGHGEAVAVPVGPGFPAPRPIEEQTEPVDFSTANEPVNFSGGPGIRPVPGFPPPGVHVAAYSRESTPDSGGSHYMDAYRDPTGEFIIVYRVTLRAIYDRRVPKTLYDVATVAETVATFLLENDGTIYRESCSSLRLGRGTYCIFVEIHDL